MKRFSVLLALVVCVAIGVSGCANQNKKLSLRRVHFDFDRSAIRTDMIPVIDGNVRYLKAHSGSSNKTVVIEGYCDERGTNEYNYALGARRAEAAKSYMITHGIKGSRLKTVSYGEDKPLCAKHDENCWYQNRRDEFRFGN